MSTLAQLNSTLTLDEVRADEALVREVQDKLIYTFSMLEPEVDGKLGPNTAAALQRFKERAGVAEEGLGTLTAKALLTADPVTILGLKLGTDIASRIVVYMLKQRYFIATGKDLFNIVYLEGMGPDGKLNDDAPNRFNDCRCVLTVIDGVPAFVSRYEATTEPGTYYTVNPMNPKGAARIAFGQYKAWRVGMHGTNSPHEALVQVGDVTVYRDKNKDYMRTGDTTDTGDYFGVNQHGGYNYPVDDIGPASAGCLVGRSMSSHAEFMRTVKSDARRVEDHNYIYVTTVIAADDMMKMSMDPVKPVEPPKPADDKITWVKMFPGAGTARKWIVGMNAGTAIRKWDVGLMAEEIAVLESLKDARNVPLLARPGEAVPEAPAVTNIAFSPLDSVVPSSVTWVDTFADELNQPILYGMEGVLPKAAVRLCPTTMAAYIEDLKSFPAAVYAPLIAPAGKAQPPVKELVAPYPFMVVQEGSSWFAQANAQAPRFLVGKETSYPPQGTRGIYLYDGTYKYDPKVYEDQFGIWAWLIYPTAFCESIDGRFACVNTWDRARFTFGFLQYAAHVPQGDFVKYFVRILQLPEAPRYFPDLVAKGDNVWQGNKALTTNDSTEGLMNYLNRSSTVVEKGEALNIAKFVHWVNNSAAHRRIMVECGIEHFRNAMKTYNRWYNIDGFPDYLCLAIADIHHQGRAQVSTVRAAIDQGGKYRDIYERVSVIGQNSYGERVTTLRQKVADLKSQGKLGVKNYNAERGDFV